MSPGVVTEAVPMKVLIIGAGLGGLACAIGCRREGLDVEILEQAPQLSEIGAGIQIPPNASRVMESFGLLDRLVSEGGAEAIERHNFVRYTDGKTIVTRPGSAFSKRRYGFAWHVIHRADYLRVLVAEVERLGVNIRLGSKVSKIETFTPYAELETGGRVHADVIIGADGLNSMVRNQILSQEVHPKETGDLAYRATIPRERVERYNDATLNRMLTQHESRVWWGNDCHAVLYPVRHATVFNLVLLVPDDLPPDVKRQPADIDQMRKIFEDWDPTLKNLISEVPSSAKWKLTLFDALDTWTKGNVALLGDACHPTFPYQAQGAAMAVEDGACVSKILGLAAKTGKASISEALQLYERVRKDRTTLNVKGAVGNRAVYHAKDGEDADRRNALLQDYDWENDPRETPLTFNDRKYQQDLMGSDVVGDAQKAFELEFGSRPGST